jgi:integrase
MPSGQPGGKGLGEKKVRRANREKFMTLEEFQTLLRKVAELRRARWRRDHCAIFCGFFFGLRISETVLINRETFRDLEHGEVHIRTKKQGMRVRYTCPDCKRRYRVAAARAGQMQTCGHCGAQGKIRLPQGVTKADAAPPECSPPVVETVVHDYVRNYLDNVMRPEQEWLFESAPGKRLARDYLRQIFNRYSMAAGLNPKYSWHCLRHGRGVMIMDQFDDLVMVRDSLRQKSLGAAEFYIHLSPAKAAKYREALDRVSDKLEIGMEVAP